MKLSYFIENNLHIKVVRHPGDSNIIILGVGQRLSTSREEGESLYGRLTDLDLEDRAWAKVSITERNEAGQFPVDFVRMLSGWREGASQTRDTHH